MFNTDFRDIKASGIYVVLYNLTSQDSEDKKSPLRIIFAGGLAGQKLIMSSSLTLNCNKLM